MKGETSERIPTPKWLRYTMATGAALLLLVLLVAILVDVFGGMPSDIAAHGTETVSVGLLDGTSAQDAYPDVAGGGQVTVIDPSSRVIGTGTLAEDYGASSLGSERFTFTTVIPGGEARYGIQVGNNRGTVWFSASQMKAGPKLCLGDGC